MNIIEEEDEIINSSNPNQSNMSNQFQNLSTYFKICKNSQKIQKSKS